MSNEAMASAYAAIAQRAWTTNRARAAELDRLVEGWRTAGALPAPEKGRLRELAHTLQGSAGTFGHPQAAEAAAVLEQLLTSGRTPHLDEITDVVAQINLGLAHPPTSELSPAAPERDGLAR